MMTLKEKSTIIKSLQTSLESISSQKKKEWWEKYMRYVIEFRGVGIPEIRKIQKDWYVNYLSHLSYEEQAEVAMALFEETLAEDKLAGVLLFQNYLYDKVSLAYMMQQYESIFEKELIYDWNICDWFCVRVLSKTIKLYDMQAVDRISKWKDESYLWQARASVVAFIGLTAHREYYPAIFENCSTLIKRDERFSKTAVGWILHDIYKEDKEIVLHFVDQNLKYFDNESLKNALKYTDKGLLQEYVKKLKKDQS